MDGCTDGSYALDCYDCHEYMLNILVTVVTVAVAVVAHDGLWEHTSITIFTLLTLLKGLTLHAIALCMNTLSYFDGLGHQELENIAHGGRGVFIEFVRREGWDGWVKGHTP